MSGVHKTNPPLRQIRSYVRREGRITAAQRRALSELWPRFGVDDGGSQLDLAALFGRDAPVILEIGFGDGQALHTMAAASPERNYLGVEVHRPGIGRLLQTLDAQAITNVRVICDDARSVLVSRIGDKQLSGVHLFFPDPWPKARHHKRRLLQPAFLEILHSRLIVGGYLHAVTDWEPYAQQMMTVLTGAQGFENCAGPGLFASRSEDRPYTKFERRGQRLGHDVWELIFRRSV